MQGEDLSPPYDQPIITSHPHPHLLPLTTSLPTKKSGAPHPDRALAGATHHFQSQPSLPFRPRRALRDMRLISKNDCTLWCDQS
jgi:hypothetical protein